MVDFKVTDEELENANLDFHYKPTKQEEFYYRSIFEEHFPGITWVFPLYRR